MAITSSTDICNMALDLLSAGTVQNVSNPSTPTEELLNRWYDQSRRKLLREHPWNCATKRAVLAKNATAPAFGYARAFPLPNDFIRLLAIGTNLSVDRETFLPSGSYVIEDNNILTSNLYSDNDSTQLIYIYDLKNVSAMDPMFIDLLAYEIALSTAYKISETNTNVQRIEQLKNERSALAKAVDGQESPPKRIERSRALQARRTLGTSSRSDKIIF